MLTEESNPRTTALDSYSALEIVTAMNAEDATVLLVTVDPERDSPEVLARYVQAYDANVLGLTGEETAIRQILAAYGAYSEPGHDHPELLAHTSLVYGIDSDGQIRVLLRPDAAPGCLRSASA